MKVTWHCQVGYDIFCSNQGHTNHICAIPHDWLLIIAMLVMTFFVPTQGHTNHICAIPYDWPVIIRKWKTLMDTLRVLV